MSSAKSRYLGRQLRNSDPELEITSDNEYEERCMASLSERTRNFDEEYQANPTMALARVSSEKIYFTADEFRLAYGRTMKPKAEDTTHRPEAITKYDAAVNETEELVMEIARIEGSIED